MTQIRVGASCRIQTTGRKSLRGTYAGPFDPNNGLPNTGTGEGGRILKSDFWDASASGAIVGLSPFADFEVGDIIISKKNNAVLVSDFFGNKGSGGSNVTDLQDAYDNGNGTITLANGKPFQVIKGLSLLDVGDNVNLFSAGAMSLISFSGNMGLVSSAALIVNSSASGGNKTLTTVGSNFWSLTNPSAVTWPRINADNTVSALSANNTLNALLPSQATNSGKFLTTDGTNTSWATSSGGVTGSGSAGQVSYWSSSSALTGNNNLFWDNTNIILYVGANSGAFTNTRVQSVGTVTSYIQNNIQNLSANAAASGDWIVTADNGTDSTLYGDFGMNSSGWSGTGVLDAANTVYLYAKNAPLSIGTDGSTDFILFSGGTASSNERLRIKSGGTIIGTLNVSTGTGTTSGMQLTANSLTTGDGLSYSSSSGTSGTLLKAYITGTAALTNSKAIYGLQSGANANVSQQTAAIYGQNIRTGGGINIGVFGYASGGTTNWAGYFGPGDVKFEANINGGSAFNYTPSGTLDVAFGSSSIPSRFLFGQSTSSYGGLVWNYNETPASAYLSIGAGNTGSSPTFILPTLNFYQTGNVQFNLLTTTGTGTTAGAQFLGNSLTTGNLIDASSTSATTGFLAKYTSTSTVINHTAGTHALVGVAGSGANSTSGKTIVGFQVLLTNTGTTSTNTAGLFRSSGATVNNSLDLVGAILLTGSAGTSGQVLTSAGAGATPTWSDHMTPSAINSVSPTSPNRTVTIVYNGTTLYLHAKTSND